MRHLLATVAIAITIVCIVTASSRAAEHPYILWTSEDLAAIKQRIETQDWAKAEWQRKPQSRAAEALHDLLDYRMFGNAEAGERQKKHLLRTLRSQKPLGGAQWVNVVRYDMVHDLLSDAEKQEIQKIFRDYIQKAIHENALFDPEKFNDERNFSRYDAKTYTLRNWLPNIVWPRRMSANLMAAAIGDEQLIRRTWDEYGSFRWYMDEYLTNSGFYGEEFSKTAATVGSMIVYCEALENLGLGELGYGYTGRFGATMKGHLASFMKLSYPIVELHSRTPHIPMITMGDLREEGSSRKDHLPTYAFQHSAVQGYLPDETGEDRGIFRWLAHGAWGGEVRGNLPQWDGYSKFTPKMMVPFWFEVGYARWPNEGFGWFLSHLREPGQERYHPSLYFGVEPIPAGEARPPYAQSWVAPRRGIAMVRAEQGLGHWTAPAGAVSMRLANEYAHDVYDSFAITGYYALNRPMLLNRQTTRGYARALGRSIASHNGVRVDGREPANTEDVQTRHWFEGPVKMFSATSDQVYPGVKLTRMLLLTDRDLIDIVDLRDLPGAKPTHTYEYMAHAIGFPALDNEDDWQRGKPLDGPLSVMGPVQRTADGVDNWSVRVEQRSRHDEPALNRLPAAWYERQVGLMITGNGGPATSVHVGLTPLRDDPQDAPSIEEAPEEYEVGGTTLVVRRPDVANTTYLTHYQPFDKDNPADRRLTQHPTDSDRIMALQLNSESGPATTWLLAEIEPADEPAAFNAPDGLTITFRKHAFVQIDRDTVRAWGFIDALTAPVEQEQARLYINGRLTKGDVSIADGKLIYTP